MLYFLKDVGKYVYLIFKKNKALEGIMLTWAIPPCSKSITEHQSREAQAPTLTGETFPKLSGAPG